VAQQATHHQRRQRQQHAALGDIQRRRKSRRRFVQQSNARRQSFQRRGRTASHRRGAILDRALTFATRHRTRPTIRFAVLAGDVGYAGDSLRCFF